MFRGEVVRWEFCESMGHQCSLVGHQCPEVGLQDGDRARPSNSPLRPDSDCQKKELGLLQWFHWREFVYRAIEQSEMDLAIVHCLTEALEEYRKVFFLHSINSAKRQYIMLFPNPPILELPIEKPGVSVEVISIEEKKRDNQLAIKANKVLTASLLTLYSRSIEIKKADLLTPSSTIRLNSMEESKASVKISIIPCVTDIITDRISTRAVVNLKLQNTTLEVDASTKISISTTLTSLYEENGGKSTAATSVFNSPITNAYTLHSKGQLKVMFDLISSKDLLLVESSAIKVHFEIHLLQVKKLK